MTVDLDTKKTRNAEIAAQIFFANRTSTFLKICTFLGLMDFTTIQKNKSVQPADLPAAVRRQRRKNSSPETVNLIFGS